MKSRISDYFSAPAKSMRSLRRGAGDSGHPVAFSLGGLLLVGLGVYLAVLLYPELRRYLHVRQM